jgi:hypothetical protein
MPIPIRCTCGAVRGTVELEHAYTRGVCYCNDCQAYQRFLGRADVPDACGGTDIVPMSPAGVRMTQGLDHVACVALSPNGIRRWYADCCKTPLGNTRRDPNIAYVGMVTACFDAAPATINTAVGPRGRIVLNAASATGKVSATPLAFFLGGVSIVRHILAAKLGKRPPSPFFDAAGTPLRTPRVLDADERAALGANPV